MREAAVDEEETPKELVTALREAIARSCEVDLARVSQRTRLDALGMDSLAAAEVVTDVEIRLGVELPPDILRQLARAETVGDVLDHFRAALATRASPA